MSTTPPPPPQVVYYPAPPPKKGGGVLKGCLTLMILAVLLLAFVGYCASKLPPSTTPSSQSSTSEGSASTAKEAAPTSVTVDELFNAYDDNEVSADNYYKGRLVQVHGRVGSINKDFLDKIYLTLPSSSNEFMGVHAELSDAAASAASQLRKGQRVTLVCTVKGKVITDVMLSNCAIQ